MERLVEIQRGDHPCRELRVYLLGDLVEGELIFPQQSHRIDASLFQQVCRDGPEILATFLRRMAGLFDKVRVVSVIGNHGAIAGPFRKQMHPESNADSMLYEIAAKITADEKRIEWAPTFTSGERHWFAVDKISDRHAFLLFHGDQARGGFAGFPWYAFGKRLHGWRNGGVPEPFDYAVCGHFHTPTRMTLNTITLWANGSTESDNTYANEELAACGHPSQWLLFCHPEHGVTAEYEVRMT